MIHEPVSFQLRQECVNLTPARTPDIAQVIAEISPDIVPVCRCETENGKTGIIRSIDPLIRTRNRHFLTSHNMTNN